MNSPSDSSTSPEGANPEGKRTAQRSIWVTVGWLAVVGMLAISFITVELGLNFLGWNPQAYEWHTVLSAFVYLAGLAAVARLARLSDPRNAVLAFILLLVLCGGGLFLATETRGETGILRLVEAPLWYRVTRSAVLFVPMIVFAVMVRARRPG